MVSTTNVVLITSAIIGIALIVACEAKHVKYNENVKNITETNRNKRAQFSSRSSWRHTEWLGDKGEVALRWKTSGDNMVFRAEVKAEGHLVLAFGNDAIFVWITDDEQPHILDCHLVNGIPMSDYSQDYDLVFGLRNHTHLVVEYKRPFDTCDPYDIVIGHDPVTVQWSVGSGDPRGGGWKGWMGKRSLHLIDPLAPTPTFNLKSSGKDTHEYQRWDVLMKNVVLEENMATIFWCKIFKAPALGKKHHIIGFKPATGKAAKHAVLYECSTGTTGEDPLWERWASQPGSLNPEMPSDWSSCLAPVAAWTSSSKGEMFPEHVGIPLGDPQGVIYYMLEIHYENPTLEKIVDNSGLSIIYSDQLRPNDGGLLVSGITISPLHVLPARQKKYKSAGYCAEPCTYAMFPENGINIVSVLLHAHSTGKQLSLRHIRNGQELPRISYDDHYDNKYQQSRILLEERNVLPGDAMLMECSYDTSGRAYPTLGGYSSKQEMCLAFILHYPRIPLAGCYSMTPVEEFFETLGVKEFYGSDMKQIENMFLASGSLESFPEFETNNFDKISTENSIQGDDQGVSLLSQLIIKEPIEFRNKTFIAHLNEIPWSEPLLTNNIEETLYKGKHMTFCKKRDESLAVPVEIRLYPTFKELAEISPKQCHLKLPNNESSTFLTTSNTSLNTKINVLLIMFILIHTAFNNQL